MTDRSVCGRIPGNSRIVDTGLGVTLPHGLSSSFGLGGRNACLVFRQGWRRKAATP